VQADLERDLRATASSDHAFRADQDGAATGQLMQHRTRDLLMRQHTQLINALRAHLAELGIVAAQGDNGVAELLAVVADGRDLRLPIGARAFERRRLSRRDASRIDFDGSAR